jgi:hypothetical protein
MAEEFVATKELIAAACHTLNKIYCESLGDTSQPSWKDAPEWQKKSAIAGVEYHLAHPESKPSDSHEEWLRVKVADGWKYGPVKDPEKKEHPCMVPFEKLDIGQQMKDSLFLETVRAFEPYLAPARPPPSVQC